MTKKRTTKRALLLSALSLLMCVSMLIGSTFAWFTDSVTSKNNIIKSGNLDVELYYQAEGQSGWTKVTEGTNIFMQNAWWEPGHTEVVKLKVINEGTLALKYKLGVNIISETGSENVLGDDFKLSDFIRFGIIDGDKTYTRDSAIEAVAENATKLNTVYGSNSIPLAAGKDKIVTMVVYMPETVGNQANHKTGRDAPVINLGINLHATQYTSEKDSFGSDYDSNATYDAPGVIISDDLKGDYVDAIKNNTALNGYIPENLPENAELIIELTSVDNGATYNVRPTTPNTEPITFRLPIPETDTARYARVSLETSEQNATIGSNLYNIQGEGNGKYVEITSANFGTFTVNEKVVDKEGVYGGVDWELYDDGTLVIAATNGNPVPDENSGKTYEVGAWREAVRYDSKGEGKAIEGWPYDRNKVTKLIIEEGVTSIGSFVAQDYKNLTGEVVIPSTVTYIGQEAFKGSNMTKLTFAKVPEGQEGKELCIAHGAFKNLIIEEVSLPADRPVHLHAWVFNNCHNLKRATLPASITSVWGTNHIDYFKDPETHANPTWTKSSELFAYDENLETITFGSVEVRDMFFQNNNNTNKDYIKAYVGLTAYSSLEAAEAAAAATGEDLVVLK